MQVHTSRRKCALQGDDFQFSLEHGGGLLARAGEAGLAHVAHHAQHKSEGTFFLGDLLKAAAQISSGVEVNGQSPHQGLGAEQLRGYPLGQALFVAHQLISI